jgi:hypothetical protein
MSLLLSPLGIPRCARRVRARFTYSRKPFVAEVTPPTCLLTPSQAPTPPPQPLRYFLGARGTTLSLGPRRLHVM